MMNPPIRRHLDFRATSLMLVLCVVWGVQQVVMKSIAVEIPPLMQLAVRFAGAALVFGALVLTREGWRGFSDGTLPSGLGLGLLFSGEFIAIGLAVMHTSASHTTVFLYSAPIFTALGVQIFPEERLTSGQWLGVAVAFLGIVVAFLGYTTKPVLEMLQGDLIAVLAGALWGSSNVWLRRTRVGTAATFKTVFYQVFVGAIVIFVYAWLIGQTTVHWTPVVILAMVYQTVGIAILSYLAWFWLLRHYLTSRLMLFSLMTPLFAVLAGWTWLGEHIDPRFALGTGLVLGGILAVNARQIFQRNG
jgi:drug/metabolite transporter (DMT)-like permease